MGLTRSCSSSSPRPPCWTLRSSTACRALNREPSKIASAAWTRSCASFRKPPTESRRRSASGVRSEEHTSELQSQSNLVCRLLLEKKKTEHRIVLFVVVGEGGELSDCCLDELGRAQVEPVHHRLSHLAHRVAQPGFVYALSVVCLY